MTLGTGDRLRDLSRSIVLTGQGHWCHDLASGLQRYASIRVSARPFDHAFRALNPSSWASLARADLVVIVGFRPGARTMRGFLFDSAFSIVQRFGPRKRIIHYWIGTDVERTLRDVREGRITGRFRSAVARRDHLAGSSALAADLAVAGIVAEVVDFPSVGIPADIVPPPMPHKFTVLSYVPDSRSEFYGGPQLLDAARALPSVKFQIVGGSGAWAACPPENLRFLGWREDMRPCYTSASCLVRLVGHDAIGGTVLEALAFGRLVVYSRPLEHTTYVSFGDTKRLIEVLGEFEREYAGASSPPDVEASAWVLHHFGPVRLFGQLAARLLEYLPQSGTGEPTDPRSVMSNEGGCT